MDSTGHSSHWEALQLFVQVTAQLGIFPATWHRLKGDESGLTQVQELLSFQSFTLHQANTWITAPQVVFPQGHASSEQQHQGNQNIANSGIDRTS